jgi:hypothetical protein
VGWTFPGEEAGGIEASFDVKDGRTTLHVQSVQPDGSPRDFFTTSAVLVGPDLEPIAADLDQIAPGVYEKDLGEIPSGAYAVRITQIRPGTAALGRTVGLVAPVAAEYRLLGANQPLLATLRAATNGREIATPLEPWRHDLRLTSSFTELWPWLLLLALLLWPLDIALRRVSLGRRELADGRAWIGRAWRRRGATAPRSAAATGMLAARDRAAGAAARAALMRAPEEAPSTGVPLETPAAPAGKLAASSDRSPETGPPPPPDPEPKAQVDAAPPANRAPGDSDTMARLREAKRRARGS